MATLKVICQPAESKFHKILRIFLRVAMITIGNSNKITYWWNWHTSKTEPTKTLTVLGDPTAKKMNNLLIGLGFWKNNVSVAPTKNTTNWRIGFKSGNKNQLCNILNNGPITMQLGPSNLLLYGLDKNNNEIDLMIVKYNYHYPVL